VPADVVADEADDRSVSGMALRIIREWLQKQRLVASKAPPRTEAKARGGDFDPPYVADNLASPPPGRHTTRNPLGPASCHAS
jgi:hypothetical protein